MDKYLQSAQVGIILTILVFALCKYAYDKTKNMLLFPLLTSSLIIIGMLILSGISFETYNTGASMISYVLGPVTVILAVPLYKQQKYLKKYFFPIMIGSILGSAFSITLLFYMSRFANLDSTMTLSMMPKSVTAPIAKGISEELGGIPVITVFAVILTGVVGPVIAPFMVKLLGIKNKIAQGIGIGTASHGGGTAKALEMGEVQGAMSGLAMGLAGVFTAILLPILWNLLSK